MSEQPGWLVTCSCRWTREAWSRWAAESMAKLHPKLSAPGIEHTARVGPALRRLPRFPPARLGGLALLLLAGLLRGELGQLGGLRDGDGAVRLVSQRQGVLLPTFLTLARWRTNARRAAQCVERRAKDLHNALQESPDDHRAPVC